jgi:PmbA protein
MQMGPSQPSLRNCFFMTVSASAKASLPTSPTELLNDLVKKAREAGADSADAMLIDATALSVGCRLGQVETLERAESGDLGLRVFMGKKQAMVSATDRKPETLKP